MNNKAIHEINNLLTSVTLSAELLAKTGSPANKKYAKGITKDAKKIAKLLLGALKKA